MRRATLLVARADFSVRAVHCHDDHTGWSVPEQAPGYGVVLARSGGFRRRGRTGEGFVDPTMGYLSVAGEEECFAHPAGGDVCTAVHVSDRLWRELFDERPAPGSLYVDAALDLSHRLLLRAASGPEPDFGAAERLVRLLENAVRAAGPGGPSEMTAEAGTRNRTGQRDRALVEAAREALRADHPAASGLLPLARLLGVSPYRLSRSFHGLVGVPLTRYRNRLRVGRALDRLERGTDDLAALAAELGFADQAHLTRTVRTHLGHPPGRLRRILS